MMRPVIFVSIVAIICCGTGKIYAQTSNDDLRIVSPMEGTTVMPGQRLRVVVQVREGVRFQAVGLVGEDIGFADGREAPPYEFDLLIPPSIIGPKRIRAFGATGPDQGVRSQPVTVNVGPPSEPGEVEVSPQAIYFTYAGEQMYLSVFLSLADGTPITITDAAATSYRSDNPSIASVARTGQVTATGPGRTNVTVAYNDRSVAIPVNVESRRPGDLDADGDIDTDDLKILKMYLGSAATGPNDARDLNKDGKIDELDLRLLEERCTRPGCATSSKSLPSSKSAERRK